MGAVRAGVGKDRRMKWPFGAYNKIINQLNLSIMKRSLVLAAGAVLVAAAVSAFVYVNNGRNSMDDLFNANVEALARNESGGSSVMCSQTRNSGNYYMKDCSNCGGSFNYYAMDRVAFCN